MGSLLRVLIIIVLSACNSGTSKPAEVTLAEYKGDTMVHAWLKGSPDSLLPVYMDSVRNYQQGMPIPGFFFDHLLDYDNPGLTDHRTWSLRKTIFDSTQNKFLLQSIIESGDQRLRDIADSNEVQDKTILRALPFAGISNYAMAVQRLKELGGN
jgi:hypothetical protein